MLYDILMVSCVINLTLYWIVNTGYYYKELQDIENDLTNYPWRFEESINSVYLFYKVFDMVLK